MARGNKINLSVTKKTVLFLSCILLVELTGNQFLSIELLILFSVVETVCLAAVFSAA